MNKIFHGDCLNILPTLENQSVHLVVTDPPYFIDGLDSDWKKGSSKKSTGTVGGLPVGMKFDIEQGKQLQSFISKVSEQLYRVLKPGSIAVFFSQPRLSHRMAIGIEDSGFEIRDMMCWHFTKQAQFKAFSMDHFVRKMNVDEQRKSEIIDELGGRKTIQLRPQFETMILAQKPKEGTHIDNWLNHKTGLMDVNVSLDGKSPSTVMNVEKPKKDDFNTHLTVKPLLLIEHLIKLFSKQGQVVLDPFMGSGTTGVACKNTNRQYVGIEVNDDYINIINKRLNNVNVDKGLFDE